jgi:hypothetical protein
LRHKGRAGYLKRGIDDTALLINGGNDIPTLYGNPNRENSDDSSEIFFHWGNYGQPRLTYTKANGDIGYISKACQTSVHGQGSRALHNAFMNQVGRDFNGKYLLTGDRSNMPYYGPFIY